MQASPSIPSPQPLRRSRMVVAAVLPALVVLLLWSVFLLDTVYDWELFRYGVLPRESSGLKGIVFMPFIHGDARHLFNNSMPLLVLGWALMYFYPHVAGRVVLAAWLIGGSWVWISARSSYHIGASGVIYGLVAFLFFSGLLRRQRTLMALSMLVVFLYGGMVWGVLPIVPGMSWEGHLWGGVVGGLMAWLYRAVPPAIQDPIRHEDPEEEEDEEDAAMHAGPHPAGASAPGMRVVYHLDPGDEVDDAELAWRRRLAGRVQPYDPDRTSGTWSDGEPML